MIKLPRRNWALGAVAAVAAAAACLAVGLGLWAHSLSNSLDRERSANVGRRAELLAENATAKPLIGANGSLIVARNGRAALLVCGLADAPSAKTYEAWVITGNSPEPAGPLPRRKRLQPRLPHTACPEERDGRGHARAGRWSTSPTLPILFRAEAT